MRLKYLILFIVVIVSCETNSYYEEKYPTGEIKLVGNLDTNGLRDGIWKTYDTYGNVTIKSHYRKDSLYLNEYYQKGILKSKEEIEEGLKHGIRWIYYDTGELRSSFEFYKGKQLGKTVDFYKTGQKRMECTYGNSGKPVDLFKQYYPDGTINLEISNCGNDTMNYYDKYGDIQLSIVYKDYISVDTTFMKEGAIETLTEDMKLMNLPE